MCSPTILELGCAWTSPRYPAIRARVASVNPWALIGATREALRRAGVARAEIHEFSTRAARSVDPYAVCRRWVQLEVEAPERSS